jgi:hypothetical protein
MDGDVARMQFPFEWRCAACRYEQWVHVKAVGANRFPTRGGPDNALDEGLARDRARQDAWRAAKMKLALRPCPKCGAIDRKTVTVIIARTFVVTTLSTIVVAEAVLLGWGVGVLFPWTNVAALAAGPLVGAATTAWLWYQRWQPSRRDVTVPVAEASSARSP